MIISVYKSLFLAVIKINEVASNQKLERNLHKLPFQKV